MTGVVRFNNKVYDRKKFLDAGFNHYDLYFADGGNPTDAILKKFLEISESEKGALAVHCKAGLGRTGTLISLYLMKHFGVTTPEIISWLRLCRPGSVIGPQQNFLAEMEKRMHREGEAHRRAGGRPGAGAPALAGAPSMSTPFGGVSDGMEGLSVASSNGSRSGASLGSPARNGSPVSGAAPASPTRTLPGSKAAGGFSAAVSPTRAPAAAGRHGACRREQPSCRLQEAGYQYVWRPQVRGGMSRRTADTLFCDARGVGYADGWSPLYYFCLLLMRLAWIRPVLYLIYTLWEGGAAATARCGTEGRVSNALRRHLSGVTTRLLSPRGVMSVCVRLQYSMRGALPGRMITGPLHTLRFFVGLFRCCVIVCCGGTAVVCVRAICVCVCEIWLEVSV